MPLKLTKIKNSQNYYVRGTVAGHVIYESTGTSNKKLAEKYRAKRESDIYEGGTFGKRDRATFADGVNSYLDSGGTDRFMELPLLAFGNWNFDDISQDDLDKAAREAYPKAAPQTINRQFYTPFIAVWNHAAKRGMCQYRPWDRPRVKRGTDRRKRFLTLYEASIAVQHAQPHFRLALLLYLYSGIRVSEGLELEFSSVDIYHQWAVIHKKKEGKPLGIPLHRVLVDEIRKLPYQSGPILRRHDGQPYEDRFREAGGQFKTTHRTLIKNSRLPHFTMHDLRRTFSTWLRFYGVDEIDRDALMGHSPKSVNRIYIGVPDEDLIAATNRLPDIRNPLNKW